jgi:hypothetical protein
MRPVRGTPHRTIALAALAAGALAVTGCGDDDSDSSGEGAQPAPAAADFPAADGRSLEELYAASNPGDLVVSPAGLTATQGRNRFGFGVFTVAQEQVTDAEVAIYAAHGPNGKAQGPFPARIESLETETAFTAKTTADDPDAAKVVYVSDLVLDAPGEWRLIALIRDDGEISASRVNTSLVVQRNDPVPAPGEPAPRVHTPTTDEVADVAEIDTRIPPSTLHEDDLADVLGKEPVVLLFATPALCQSRVCGPVVDVAEQVKNGHQDEAAFIQMEIYEDNDPNKGLRPQVRAYNLQTEPWLFVIDRKGRVSSRIEGAFSVAELEQALDGVIG